MTILSPVTISQCRFERWKRKRFYTVWKRIPVAAGVRAVRKASSLKLRSALILATRDDYRLRFKMRANTWTGSLACEMEIPAAVFSLDIE